MIGQPEIVLIAAAAFPIFSAMGGLIAESLRRHWATLAFARLGFGAGATFAIWLAVLLADGSDLTARELRIHLWTWFSFSSPEAPSISFGLQATWITASLVGLIGGLGIVATGQIKSRDGGSNNAILAVSLLYCAIIIFVFAPNTAQAVLGWSGVSLMATVLARLARQQTARTTIPAVTKATLNIHAPLHPAPQPAFQSLRMLATLISSIEKTFTSIVRQSVITTFPNWIGEQAEELDSSAISIRLVAAALAAFAMVFVCLR